MLVEKLQEIWEILLKLKREKLSETVCQVHANGWDTARLCGWRIKVLTRTFSYPVTDLQSAAKILNSKAEPDSSRGCAVHYKPHFTEVVLHKTSSVLKEVLDGWPCRRDFLDRTAEITESRIRERGDNTQQGATGWTRTLGGCSEDRASVCESPALLPCYAAMKICSLDWSHLLCKTDWHVGGTAKKLRCTITPSSLSGSLYKRRRIGHDNERRIAVVQTKCADSKHLFISCLYCKTSILLLRDISECRTGSILQIPVVRSPNVINIICETRASDCTKVVMRLGGAQCDEGVRIKMQKIKQSQPQWEKKRRRRRESEKKTERKDGGGLCLNLWLGWKEARRDEADQIWVYLCGLACICGSVGDIS